LGRGRSNEKRRPEDETGMKSIKVCTITISFGAVKNIPTAIF